MSKKKAQMGEGVFFEHNGKVEFLEQKYFDALIELGLIEEVNPKGEPITESKRKEPPKG